MIRIVFFGTPDFAKIVLEKIYPHVQVLGVFTQPDKPKGRVKKLLSPPVKVFAIEKGIPVFQPEKLRSKEVKDMVKELNPEALVVASYGKIIPEDLLFIPPLGGINVHASILPKYRGAAPIERAILNCEEETGISIMKMDAGLDTGPVYTIKRIPIFPEDDKGTLTVKLANIGAETLLEVLPLIRDGKIIPFPQKDEEATYAPKITKEEEKVDWEDSVKKIWCKIRAFSPEPGAYTLFRGFKLKIYKTSYEFTSLDKSIPNGTIIKMEKEKGIGIKGKDGILWILEVQPESKRKMTFKEFINGYRLNIGELVN